MEFPAVTLCNLNSFKKSKISLGGKELENAIKNYENVLLNQLYTAEGPTSIRKREAGSAEMTTPDFEMTTPDFEMTTPDFEMTTPDFEMTTPDFEMTTPDFEMTTPDFEMTTPDFEMTTPDFEMTTPGLDSVGEEVTIQESYADTTHLTTTGSTKFVLHSFLNQSRTICV